MPTDRILVGGLYGVLLFGVYLEVATEIISTKEFRFLGLNSLIRCSLFRITFLFWVFQWIFMAYFFRTILNRLFAFLKRLLSINPQAAAAQCLLSLKVASGRG